MAKALPFKSNTSFIKSSDGVILLSEQHSPITLVINWAPAFFAAIPEAYISSLFEL